MGMGQRTCKLCWISICQQVSSSHINDSNLYSFSQCKSYDRNVIHDVCECYQALFGNQYYDYTVGSQVVHDNVNKVGLTN